MVRETQGRSRFVRAAQPTAPLEPLAESFSPTAASAIGRFQRMPASRPQEANPIDAVLGPAMRGRLRTKERKLKRLATIGIRFPTLRARSTLAKRVLRRQGCHLSEQGLANVFAETGVASSCAQDVTCAYPTARG